MSKMFPGSDPGAPIAVMGHGFPDIADWLLGGDSSTDRVVNAKSQSQRHFRTFVVSNGSIFLACFEIENPKA